MGNGDEMTGNGGPEMQDTLWKMLLGPAQGLTQRYPPPSSKSGAGIQPSPRSFHIFTREGLHICKLPCMHGIVMGREIKVLPPGSLSAK